MSYQVYLSTEAVDDLSHLDKTTAQQIKDKLTWLAANVTTAKTRPLTGMFKGSYKLRVGDYRVLYTLNKASKFIFVRFVGHRSSIYKLK
jgi:mRNA interferase RelE/StbE